MAEITFCPPDFRLSEHFRFYELCETIHYDLLNENRCLASKCVKSLYHCAAVLEFIRYDSGYPLRISSGFRSSALNKKVGGVVNSSHLFGYAVDILVEGQGSSITNAILDSCNLAKQLGIVSYVKYSPLKNYIHITITH